VKMGYWNSGDRMIGVLGMGRSGTAAAALLKDRGFRVYALDRNSVDDNVICDNAAVGDREVEKVLNSLDGIVISPGVDPASPIPSKARDMGIPVIGEIELAFRNSNIPVLAITGSNGKTTTAEWLGHVLNCAGTDACVAGNTGYPYSRAVLERADADFVVLEVSSYQLQTIEEFRPLACTVLNITPDHLQRHGSLQGYVQAKARIFMNQMGDDVLLLNMDDPGSVSLFGKTMGEEWHFSTEGIVKAGAFSSEGRIHISRNGSQRDFIDTSDISLPGKHNLSNALAVTALAARAGLGPEEMVPGLTTFRGVPHRIQTLTEFRGVTIVNDSKSTNPDSLDVALKSFERPIILIAGGLAKDVDYRLLRELITEKVKALVLIGRDAARLNEEWTGTAPIYIENTMEPALRRSLKLAEHGDVILLSPGCASFDQYSNFEERGRDFADLVEVLCSAH